MNTVITYQNEIKYKRIATAVTVVIHILLLILLFWIMLMPPDPPIEYGGMELSMSQGQPDMGGPSPVPVEEPMPTTPPTAVSEEQIATQDIEEAPEVKAVEKPKKKTEAVKPTKVEPVEQPRTVDQRAIFKKKSNNASASGSGDGDIPGNEGNPNGVPNGSPDGNGIGDGKGGTGGGTGNGDGWGNYNLAGRGMLRRPTIEDNSKETGKVVVLVVVDRNGRVVKATPGQKGTTTSSSVLWEKAKQGALDAKFSAKPDGPEEQYGTITINFQFKP